MYLKVRKMKNMINKQEVVITPVGEDVAEHVIRIENKDNRYIMSSIKRIINPEDGKMTEEKEKMILTNNQFSAFVASVAVMEGSLFKDNQKKDKEK